MKKKFAFCLALLMSAAALTSCGLIKSSQSSKSKGISESSVVHKTSTGEDFQRGVIENNTYSSKFSGVALTAPDGWTFSSEEELLRIMNISQDLTYKNDELTKKLLSLVAIYDAMITNNSTGSNIIIAYENLAKEVPNPGEYTINEYISAMETRFSSDLTSTHTKLSQEDVDLDGMTFTKDTYLVSRSSGDDLTQVYYFQKIDNFIYMILVTTTNPAEIPDIESHFSAL